MGIFHLLWGADADPDTVFAYDTVKELHVLDRRMGMSYYTLFVAIAVYVSAYAFGVRQLYLDRETASGWVLTRALVPPIDLAEVLVANGDAASVSTSVPLDLADLIPAGGEQGAVLVPTKLTLTRGQSLDTCHSLRQPCEQNTDCGSGKCDRAAKLCLVKQWCPESGGDSDEEVFLDAGATALWFQPELSFPTFGLDISTGDAARPIRYPRRMANTYTLQDLLQMAGLALQDVADRGAVLAVRLTFDCELDESACTTHVESVAVDTTTGFTTTAWSGYLDSALMEARHRMKLAGVRVIARAVGSGSKTSLSMIVLQISSGIALLAVAQTIVDLVMQNLVAEKRHYERQKVLQSEDFNE